MIYNYSSKLSKSQLSRKNNNVSYFLQGIAYFVFGFLICSYIELRK